MRSVRQGLPLLSLLYLLTFEPPLHKLEALRGILRNLGHRRSAYTDDVTGVVSDHKHKEMIGTDLRDYDAISGATINQEESVGLPPSNWRSKSMSPNCVVGRWTDGPIKLLGVWFGPDRQIDKNRGEVMSSVNTLVQKYILLPFDRRALSCSPSDYAGVYTFPLQQFFF